MIKYFFEFKNDLAQLHDLNLKGVCRELCEVIEQKLIEEALKRAKGRRGRAAKLLGVDVKTLYNKLRKKDQKSVPDISCSSAQPIAVGK